MSTTSSTSLQPIPSSWIEKLFDQMLLEYGKKFTDQWGGADPDKLINHWSQKLAGYSGAELSRGLAALEGRDWPPTLPEFKSMCRPPVDPMTAYYEAVNGVQERERGEVGTWSHPAIFWASVSVTAHDLKTLSYSQIKVRWESALADQMAKGEWPEIRRPELALPAPGATKTDREAAAKKMQELQAGAVVKKASDKVDHRAWIAKILERKKRKDPTLPGIAVRMAMEAMKTKEA